MGCLLESIFKFILYKSIADGLPTGEYFQVHPYKSIEDGLPVGRVFSRTPS